MHKGYIWGYTSQWVPETREANLRFHGKTRRTAGFSFAGTGCLHCRLRPPTFPSLSQGGLEVINIVLVDDHELVRTGFRMILQQQPDVRIRGEAGTAEEGLRLIRTLAPDVALVDVHMPGMSGIELTERVLRAKLNTHIIIITVVDDARFPKRLLDAGALGYLTKGCSAD